MKASWDEAKGAGRQGLTTDYGPRTTDEGQWLPPFAEWDFRIVRERESRLACCWEYARNVSGICNNLTGWLDGPGGLTTLGNYICTEGLRFPEPWLMGGNECVTHAEQLEVEDSPITVYSLNARKEYVLREVAAAMAEGRDVVALLNQLLLSEGYVMTLNFETTGSHAVGKALTLWAREEAKRFPRVPRGKGAAPPFERLKWLAALRLEGARQEAGLSFGEVQAMLARHQQEYPMAQGSPTLPVYASHGAWSKAIGEARRSLELLATEPVAFEQRILLG